MFKQIIQKKYIAIQHFQVQQMKTKF